MQNATGVTLGAAPCMVVTPASPAGTRSGGSSDGTDFESVLARPDRASQAAAHPLSDREGDVASQPESAAEPDEPAPDDEAIDEDEPQALTAERDMSHQDRPSLPSRPGDPAALPPLSGHLTGEKTIEDEGRPTGHGWPGNGAGAERQAPPDRVAQPSVAASMPDARGAGIMLRGEAAPPVAGAAFEFARGTAAPMLDQRRTAGLAESVGRETTLSGSEGNARVAEARFAGALPVVPLRPEQTAGAVRPQSPEGAVIALHAGGLSTRPPEAVPLGIGPGRNTALAETALVRGGMPTTGPTGEGGKTRAGWRDEAAVAVGQIATEQRGAANGIPDRAQEAPAPRPRSIPEVEFLSRFHDVPATATVATKAPKGAAAPLAPGGRIAEAVMRSIGGTDPLGGIEVPRGADHGLPQHQAEQRAAGVGTMPGTVPRPEAAPVFRQIVQAMPQVANGTVEVALSPEELGTVRLRFVPGEAGLVVHVTADRPETLDLMRRHVDQLAQDLARSGHNASGFTFDREGSERRAPARPPADPELSPLQAPGPQADTPRRPAGTSAGGIDIRV